MEIKDINPIVKQVFQIVDLDGQEQKVTFEVKYIPPYALPDYVPGKASDIRLSKMMTEALVDAIVGWDVTIGGKPLPCTRENRERFLPALLSARVVGADPKSYELESYLIGAVSNFAGEQKNFLKN